MFDIVWYGYHDGDIENLIKKAKEESKTEYVWLANRDVDYSNFNFRWMPNRHQIKYKHAWASHNNAEHFTTWLIPVNKDEGIVHHNEILPAKNNEYYDRCLLNTKSFSSYYSVNFQVALITTVQAAIDIAVNKASKPWLWIISDTIEYDEFNFDWLPSNHEINYIHCWPSGNCEKGDTFLINVDAYKKGHRNFNFNHEPLKRKRWPVMGASENGIAWDLKNKPNTNSIYAIYSYTGFVDYPDVCLWEKRPVVSLNNSNSSCLVPRDCIIEKEVYEYPYLLRYPEYGFDIPIDVIMISNGESCADKNWKRLGDVRGEYKVRHIRGIGLRLKAYQTAAKQSSSPWFIAVFAKCYMLDSFKNFKWQPDFWQEPKHYIFYNHNLDNDLTYGHMAPIAYNKKLMLENTGGLDMTLAQQHTVVPIVLSETTLVDDPWLSWRTAFREVVKIIHYNQKSTTIESEHRLYAWKNSKDLWQRRGAEDAEVYYTYGSKGGDQNTILETSEWDWLRQYFNSRYSAEITV